MSYKVIQDFTDGEGGKAYYKGDVYPSNKKKARLEELLGDKHPNHTGPIIEEVANEGE